MLKKSANQDALSTPELKLTCSQALVRGSDARAIGPWARDSTLFRFTTRQMRDFIDPDRLLIQMDEQLDFAKLAAPLEERYCPDYGRPAIHPEVMVRALLVCSV